MKNKYSLIVEQWLEEEGTTPPLLVTAYREKSLSGLVDEATQWLLDNKMSAAADIIIYQTDKATISIKQIRELLSRVSYRLVAQRRLVVVREAEKLSLPAANALLKFLEEAPENSRYLLTTRNKRRLLPTILSRCVIVPMGESFSYQKQDYNPYEKTTWLQKMGAAGSITDREVDEIVDWLDNRLRQEGPSQELRLAMRRAVDYYRVKSANGNEKLAKEVFLASLPQK